MTNKLAKRAVNEVASLSHPERDSGSRRLKEERFRIKYGMTLCDNNGFTLIELLVVVLIIGILAGVALPQYNKAVVKARVVEIQQFFNTVEKAMELHIMENGLQNSVDVPLTDLAIDTSSMFSSCQEHCVSKDGSWFTGKTIFTRNGDGIMFWATSVELSGNKFGDGSIRWTKGYNGFPTEKECVYYAGHSRKAKLVCDTLKAQDPSYIITVGS